MKVLLEKYPYRYIEGSDRGYIEKFDDVTKRWTHMYECDSELQLCTAMEDYNYTLWLDPAGVPCYRDVRGDVVRGSGSK